MEQLRFTFGRDKQSLADYLENVSQRRVSLVITDNSTSLVSVKPVRTKPSAERGNPCRTGTPLILRLHNIFLSADEDVLDEMAEFIRDRRTRTPLIRKFISDNNHRIKRRSARKVSLRPDGTYHDLLVIYSKLNEEYFQGTVCASITWSMRKTKGSKRRVRIRTLGSYDFHGNIIRINPLLDSKRVPRYYLEFIVYHEMLHAYLGVDPGARGRTFHTREFKRRERMFQHYHKARLWENRVLD